ncbi:hypothetical protein NDU88_002290 [Pleurodeles waltl]|uniref:Uncharacterized protein n=1 Tax=Pleurodeles waltl TaxID=8319 RepID=A0AAV7TM62_PLEWA|nr:hypothetical protein NDU88_002290 [Pleurodeles waltl]
MKGADVNLGGLTWEDAKEDDESEDSSGPLYEDGPAGCNNDNWMRQTEPAVKGGDVNLGGLTWEDAKGDNESEDSGRPLHEDGLADCNNDDWTRRTEAREAPSASSGHA